MLYDNILRDEQRQWFRILPAMYAANREEVLDLARDFQRDKCMQDTLYPLAVAQLRNQLLFEGRSDEAVALYRERFPRLFEAEGPDIGPDNYRAAIDLALAMQESGEPQAADRLLEAAAAFIESRPRLGLGSGYGISDVQILALQGEPEAALERARGGGDGVLFLDAGDSFGGTLYDAHTRGRVTAESSNCGRTSVGQVSRPAREDSSRSPARSTW